MTSHLHISSLVVTAKPALAQGVVAQIVAMPIAEVAYADDVGKIIVALETIDESAIVSALTDIQLFKGVVSAALVYHHAEDAALSLTLSAPSHQTSQNLGPNDNG